MYTKLFCGSCFVWPVARVLLGFKQSSLDNRATKELQLRLKCFKQLKALPRTKNTGCQVSTSDYHTGNISIIPLMGTRIGLLQIPLSNTINVKVRHLPLMGLFSFPLVFSIVVSIMVLPNNNSKSHSS